MPVPQPGPEDIYDYLSDTERDHHAEHYRRDAIEFDYFEQPPDEATRHAERRLHEAILRELPAEARTVLDVGCGRAWVARELLPRGREVISFDIAPRNVAEALRRYPAPQHRGVVGDAYDLPFRDGSIDAIVSSEVMEHVGDVPRYLANLIRVIRPGGRVIISTPYNERIQYSLCIHCNRPTPWHAHLHSFNEAVVKELLRPFERAINYRTETLANKALLHLRTHSILGRLPYSIWRLADRGADRIIRRPGRLLTIIEKR